MLGEEYFSAHKELKDDDMPKPVRLWVRNPLTLRL